jgi:hypothetical protein
MGTTANGVVRRAIAPALAMRMAVLAAVLVAAPAHAQDRAVDVSKLPINVARVQRALRASETQEVREGLNLKYVVTVYGQAPRIQLFTKADNLALGRAPYGGPTHSDILEVITPKEFRAPAADFGAAIRWLTEKAKEKSR